MEYKNIILSVEKEIAILTFNRPKALNAMNAETVSELMDAVTFCKKDKSVKALILTGSGDRAFVAGADIAYMQTLSSIEALKFMEEGQEVMRFIEALPKPTIAAVNGYALGGGTEISLVCDIRIAAENAVFGQPEILIGVIPGWGGTQRLPRLVGTGIAKEIILGGSQVDARRAYEIGLVNKVVPRELLMEEAKKLALKLAELPPFTYKMAKYSINYGYDMALDNACRLEAECCAQCFSTQDQKEGMKAFLEKRKPDYQGK